MSLQALLKEMEEYAVANRVPIIAARGRAAFIQTIQKNKPRHILEIGTAIGYSTLLLMRYSGADAEATTLEIDSGRAAIARSFINRSPYRDRIHLLEGDAAQLLPALNKTFDFVFIDAAKGQYPRYLALLLPHLADGATIAADNVLFRGYVGGEKKTPRRYKTIVARLQQYIRTVTGDPHFSTELYEDGDGLAVSSYHKL